MSGKTFAPISAILRSELHPTLNQDINIDAISASNTRIKLWWLCNNNHSYTSNVNNRSNGTGCPICANRITIEGVNDLMLTHPEIASRWNYELNGELKPQHINSGYTKPVWLKCVEHNHDVNVKITNCINGPKTITCVYCANKKVLKGFNDLATTHPEIIKYWHPTKNGPLSPEKVVKGFKNKTWWTCSQNHEYESLITNRINAGDRCPYCEGTKVMTGLNDLKTTHPELVKEWDYSKNSGLDPENLTKTSNRKVFWVCSRCSHSWSSTIHNRSKNFASRSRGCPVCSGAKISLGTNDLATTHPELIKELHPTLNLKTVTGQTLTAGMPVRLWWLCEKGHEFPARVRDRTVHGGGCKKCYHLTLPTNTLSLSATRPDIAAEWDYVRNTTFTPETAAQNSSKNVSWICSVNSEHHWNAVISNRTRFNSGCPICWKKQTTSGPEKEIYELFTQLNETIELNTRKYLNGKELDLYFPEYKFAIEYNGLYWHSEAAGKDKNYHHTKFLEAEKAGITLFQIWEDDWITKKEIIIRHIAYQINMLKELQKICPEMDKAHFETNFARKLQIVNISYKEASEFLEDTHIQGAVKGTHYFSLQNQAGSICAVMVLAKTGTQDEILLARYSTKGIIPGGFTKLLNYAKNLAGTQKIVTFADRTISNGKLYEKSGFTAVNELRPDYMYVKNKKKYHKFGFRLKSFQNREDLIFVENHTEKELAEINGYTRIWDAGKTKYVLQLTD